MINKIFLSALNVSPKKVNPYTASTHLLFLISLLLNSNSILKFLDPICSSLYLSILNRNSKHIHNMTIHLDPPVFYVDISAQIYLS